MRYAALTLAIAAVLLCRCGGETEPTDARASADQLGAGGSAGALPAELLDAVVVPFNRGVALMDQFKPSEAAVAFGEVVAAAPNWALGRLNYGIALLNAQQDPAAAERELKWVIQNQPDNPYGHYALGMLLRHQGRLEEAKSLFREVLRIDPEDADAHYQLGTLIQDQDPAAARAHLEKTLAKIPHHESACYNLSMMLRRSGEPERARALLNRFQTLRRFKAGAFSGMKYGEMGRYAEVVRVFDAPPAGQELHGAPAYVDVATDLGLDEPSTAAPGRAGPATSFAPALAAADLTGDGRLSLYLTGMAAGGALYRQGDGVLEAVEGAGVDGRGAIGAWFGDYDRDGDPDLYLTCDGPNRLYRNDGDGRFTDVTAASGTAGGGALSVGAVWADADHDGDLDLYVANYADQAGAGAPNALWRNNGDGTFVDVAAEAGVDGGKTPTTAALYLDFDDDRDLDLYLIHDGAANQLFFNERVGAYTEVASLFPALADDGPGLGALAGDLDGDGRQDLLLLRGAAPPRLLLNAGGAYVEDARFAALVRTLGGAGGGLVGDLDLDGDADLVLLDVGDDGTVRDCLLMNRGAGQFDPPATLGETRKQARARGALALDLDDDGALELIVARAGAPPQVWRAPAPAGRHWLSVWPAKSESEDKLWLDPGATGLTVEIKSGPRLQAVALHPSNGYLASPPRRAHFGLGAHGTADYVRLSWADGVFQSELEVAADQRWRIGKMIRKASSCPILFSWDGERFAYVTDFLGVGGSGFFTAPGEYGKPDPSEHVRIPPGQIQPKDGRYLLRVAEPLEEITYLDYARLIAYDHPRDWEIYPDERFSATEPAPTGQPRAVAEKIAPRAAFDHRGRDALSRLTAVDRDYAAPPADPRFPGYAEDHWLELDFSGQLDGVDEDAVLALYLHGWVEYTFSHVNYAAWQAGIVMEPPRIEQPDGSGGWRVVDSGLGFPAGLPRMMTYDVSGLDLRNHGRLRIRTNMRVFWDQIFLAVDVRDSRVRAHVLTPAAAELGYLGYPREYSPDGREPTLYDYHRVDRGVPFKNMAGGYTRFGEVGALLWAIDDRFVVMGRGEEIALAFEASALPPLAPGYARTFVFHADGYCKDMDLYTAFPDTVEPMPYRAMDNYPPSRPPPNEAELAADRRKWNTRRIAGRARNGER